MLRLQSDAIQQSHSNRSNTIAWITQLAAYIDKELVKLPDPFGTEYEGIIGEDATKPLDASIRVSSRIIQDIGEALHLSDIVQEVPLLSSFQVDVRFSLLPFSAPYAMGHGTVIE
ncbi:hypothetical protein M422DRAFT_273205 [Sphaerobolus stellatus SS14]|uniref:Uncharacterized protein n=1 Tax=Sphaerobolus stellatus (strain SS14) TaxID=990650 RepID=A0A0C9TVD6_SPHS4|nr:hypothetical protein M422DRAFT_273205 [Sphaerobolus stellatus SS14]